MPFPYPFPIFGVQNVPVGFSFTPQFRALTTSSTATTGSDVSTFPGLDPSMKEREAVRMVGEALARRLITPRGLMRFHPDDGTDIRVYLSAAVTPEVLPRIKHDVELEALQDERISNADVTATYDFTTRALSLVIGVELDNGPYRFTIQVDQLTSTLLAIEEG